jgi:ribokinase
MRVLNFGSLNIDHTYRVDHIAAPGETVAAESLSYAPGGKGLNQSIALARTGLPTFHAGCVGRDGQMLTDTLRDAGVHTDYLIPVEEINGHAVIQVSRDGQNCIFIHGGSNQSLTAEQAERILSGFIEDTVVLMQNETSQVAHIAEKCRELGIPLAFNPSPFTPDLTEGFPFDAVRYLLVNETEGQELSGGHTPDQIADILMRRYPEMHIILTLGSHGVYYAGPAGRIRQDAFIVDTVDTTGAGDTFTGFFLGLLLQGYQVSDALRHACAAAALSVTVAGAAPSIPQMEAVKAFLRERQ